MYPIGTPGQPWGEEEKKQWLAAQSVKRSYADEVLSQLDGLPCLEHGRTRFSAARRAECRTALCNPLGDAILKKPANRLVFLCVVFGQEVLTHSVQLCITC